MRALLVVPIAFPEPDRPLDRSTIPRCRRTPAGGVALSRTSRFACRASAASASAVDRTVHLAEEQGRSVSWLTTWPAHFGATTRERHVPPPGVRDGTGAGRVRYVGPCWPRSQRSPPMTSSSCSRGTWPMAPNKVAIGDAAAGGIADDVGAGGIPAADGALALLAGSSVPRIARQAIAPAERASDPASCASAVRISASSSSSRGARSEGFGVSVVSLMMVPFE